jgi:hypothetical protein
MIRWQSIHGARYAAVLGVAGAVIACGASIDERKIPAKTQYSHWSDEDQRKADEIQGFRYYLPRPYIVVKKEFPWASKSIIVPGAVSLDGKYILLDPKTLTSAGLNALSELGYPSLTDTDAGAALVLAVASSAATGGGSQLQGNQVTDGGASDAGKDGSTGGGHWDADGGGDAAGGKDASPAGDGESDAGSSFTLAGSSTAHTVTLSEYVDLLYAPDFDEQIAVKPSGGVSKMDFSMQLGNGWMLESVNGHIDNASIGSFIMDQIGKTADLARSAVKLIPGLQALQGQVATTGPQPSAVKALVKITTVELVVPGVYPIYTSRELMECAMRAPSGASGCNAGSAGWGNILRFHTRTDVLLQVVTTAPPSGSDGSSGGGGPSPGAAVNSPALNAALMKDAQDQVTATRANVTIKDVVGDVASGKIAVTVACPDPSKSKAAAMAAKKEAGRIFPPSVFQKDAPSTTAVSIKCDNGA